MATAPKVQLDPAADAIPPNALEIACPGTLPMLRHLAACRFKPAYALDIGAYHGEWGTLAARVWPSADVLLVEANPEKETILRRVVNHLGHYRCKFVPALLGAHPAAPVPFYLCEGGSSVYRELTGFQKREIALPMTTLDTVIGRTATPHNVGPWILKIDVQGAELDVLRGGVHVLQNCEVVLMELSTIEYDAGSPLFAEAIAYMDAAGFCAYDFNGAWRRQTDNTMFQIDAVFVRRDSQLRAYKKFWINEPDMQEGKTA